jgi:beta-lactamase regulating signal transducer with metallopeptidase domain
MNEPLETIARTIVVALAVGVAYSAVLAAFVAIVIRLTSASAATRHALWWLALAGSAAIPLASVATSLARVEHHAIAPTPSVAEPFAVTVNGVRFTVPTVPVGIVGEAPTESPVAATETSAVPHHLLDLALAYPHAGEVFVALLFCVAIGGWIMLVASFASLRTLKLASVPLDESVARRLRRFRHSARSGRAVELRVSSDVDVPVAVGFRTPAILLPTSLAHADETLAATGDLDQIVLHEYAHLERYDDWTNALQLVLVRAFWFNPFVAFFAARIALEREIASDDWVVARTGRAHRYATCLWKLVEAVKLPTRRIAAPGALFSPRQITVRIEQLLDSRRSALQRFSPFGASLTAMVAIALVVVAAVRAPAIAIDVAEAPVSTSASPNAPMARAVAPTHALPPARSHLDPPAAPAALRAVPHVALTPAPTHARDKETLVLHGVPVEATPEAIARAVATAVAASEHAVVETSVSRLATGPHSYADEIGINVSHKVTDALAPLGPAIASAVAMDSSRVVADAAAGNAGEAGTAFLHGCQGCDLSGANLHGRDFHGVAWNMVAVNGANLSDANFRGANLTGVDFHGANLSGADFTGARIYMSDLHGANLDGAILTNARFNGSDLHGVSMRGTHLDGTSIDTCDLHGTDLHAADTRGARISGSTD